MPSSLRCETRADPARIGEGDHGAALVRGAGGGELGVGDHLAQRALAGRIDVTRQIRRDRADGTLRQRLHQTVVGGDQLGLLGRLGIGVGAHDQVVGLGAHDVARLGVEHHLDLGDDACRTCRRW